MEEKLLNAIYLGVGKIQVISELLSQGINVNLKYSDGYTLLHMAVIKRNPRIVKLLIDSGADVNIKNEVGETALYTVLLDHQCDKSARATIMKMLIMAGADVETKTILGRSALHAAVEVDDVEFVRFLLSKGADVNSKTFQGITALHCAAENVNSEDPSIFKVLLSAGADVNARTRRGKTPLHLLSLRRANRFISLINIAKVFSEYGADFNARGANGQTPMDHAIENKKTKVVEALILAGGVDVNSTFKPNSERSRFDLGTNGRTILHKACAVADLETVKFLLKNGANVNALDDNGASPLHYLIDSIVDGFFRKSKNKIVKMSILRYLLKFNPDVNIITKEGFNILTRISNEKDLWMTIIKHLAKLYAIDNNSIQPNLLVTIFEDLRHEFYFDECHRELEIMKNTRLHSDSWVTVFNILVDDKRKVVQYAGNTNLSQYIRGIKFYHNFPIYGVEIYNKFSRALTKRLILDQAARRLSALVPVNMDSRHPVITNILRFFTVNDLLELC